MANDPPDIGSAELFDAFMHPPRIVSIGHRSVSVAGEIRIVSHIELWPWRVVVRGTRANRHAVPKPSQRLDSRASSPLVDPATSVPSVVGAIEIQVSPSEDHRVASRWFMNWRLIDDVGSEYRPAGGGGHGAHGWSDFAIQFEPAVAVEARRVSIETPDGDVIEVPLEPVP